MPLRVYKDRGSKEKTHGLKTIRTKTKNQNQDLKDSRVKWSMGKQRRQQKPMTKNKSSFFIYIH